VIDRPAGTQGPRPTSPYFASFQISIAAGWDFGRSPSYSIVVVFSASDHHRDDRVCEFLSAPAEGH